MSKQRHASVWEAIEDTPAEVENMKLRSELMMALKKHIARTGMSQAQAAKLFGVTQPRVLRLDAREDQPVRYRRAGQHGCGGWSACGNTRASGGLSGCSGTDSQSEEPGRPPSPMKPREWEQTRRSQRAQTSRPARQQFDADPAAGDQRASQSIATAPLESPQHRSAATITAAAGRPDRSRSSAGCRTAAASAAR